MADQTTDASQETPHLITGKAPNDHPPDPVECPTPECPTTDLDLYASEVISLGASGSNFLHNA